MEWLGEVDIFRCLKGMASQKNIFLFEQSKLHKKYFYTLCHKDDVDSIITM